MSQINPLMLAQLFLGKMSEGAATAQQFRQDKRQAEQDAQQQENFNTEQGFRQSSFDTEQKFREGEAKRSQNNWETGRADNLERQTIDDLRNTQRDAMDWMRFSLGQKQQAIENARQEKLDAENTKRINWNRDAGLAEQGAYQGSDQGLSRISQRTQSLNKFADMEAGAKLVEQYRKLMPFASDVAIAKKIAAIAPDGDAKNAALSHLSEQNSQPSLDVSGIGSIFGSDLTAEDLRAVESQSKLYAYDPIKANEAAMQTASIIVQRKQQQKAEKLNFIAGKLEWINRDRQRIEKALENPDLNQDAREAYKRRLLELSDESAKYSKQELDLNFGTDAANSNPFTAEPPTGMVGPPSSMRKIDAPALSTARDGNAGKSFAIESLRQRLGPAADDLMPYIGEAKAAFKEQNGRSPNEQEMREVIATAIDMARNESGNKSPEHYQSRGE